MIYRIHPPDFFVFNSFSRENDIDLVLHTLALAMTYEFVHAKSKTDLHLIFSLLLSWC